MDPARVVLSALAARRAHERALHDGVQQDLIAASVRVQLARELVASDPGAAIAILDELRVELHDALSRVQDVADEIYPSVLDARGLPGALRALGVTCDGVGRYPSSLEAAVYFCCRALITEAATAIVLRGDGENLQLEIDGVEPNDDARDLVEAAGGTLTATAERVIATFPRDTESQP